MILFDSRNPYYKQPFGAVESGSALFLRIAAAGGKSAVSACLTVTNDETGTAVTVEGAPVYQTEGPAEKQPEKLPEAPGGLTGEPESSPDTGLIFERRRQKLINACGFGLWQMNYQSPKPFVQRFKCRANIRRRRIAHGGSNRTSRFEFHIQIDETGLYFYHFEVLWQDGEIERTAGRQLTVYSRGYTTPRWLKAGVMYQIFPDRFARSENYRAPRQNKDYILREDWGGTPIDKPDDRGVVRNNDFFGGNLRGIIEKLGYLEALGVTVIYLNPVFEAYSNHRYDTADFMKIDPMLGTEEDFREMCEKAEEKGIRVILDGVFNHTGSDSVYFNKDGRYPGPGAYQSKDSPYYKWYRFTGSPGEYESWWGIDTLPGVDETEPSYLDFIVRSEDSVVKHWLRCGASGFRLDVADELPDEFLEALRAAVKEIRPDGAVIGEVWEDASNKVSYGRRKKYFLGNQLDSVMNYPLKNAVIDFLSRGGDGAGLERTVNDLWENYPGPAFNALMNILGTHDTKRILTVLSETAGDEEEARQRLFLALLIVSFMPGIPCVYYGDETGMKGGKDPHNRMCFDPGRGDPAILRFYRRLFAFRRKIGGLEEYMFQPRSAGGSFYSFARAGKDGRLVIAANSGGCNECGGGNDSISKSDAGGCLLDLELSENEYLKDFFISGAVSFETQGAFRIGKNSGIAAWIARTS